MLMNHAANHIYSRCHTLPLLHIPNILHLLSTTSHHPLLWYHDTTPPFSNQQCTLSLRMRFHLPHMKSIKWYGNAVCSLCLPYIHTPCILTQNGQDAECGMPIDVDH